MKHLLTIIICIAIFNISCNQNNTTPTTPPATGYTIDSSYYFKINFNGQTLYDYSVKDNQTGLLAYCPFGILGGDNSTNPPLHIISGSNAGKSNILYTSGNLDYNFVGFNMHGNTALGNYNLHSDGLLKPSFKITDYTGLTFSADTNSTTLSIQSIDASTLKITGLMSGNFIRG